MTFHNKTMLPKHHGTLKALLLLKVCLKKKKNALQHTAEICDDSIKKQLW